MTDFWWGEAPEWPETFNEAAGIDESQSCARPIACRAAGLPCRYFLDFRQTVAASPNHRAALCRTIYRGSASALV